MTWWILAVLAVPVVAWLFVEISTIVDAYFEGGDDGTD